jgi:hypothetical protein
MEHRGEADAGAEMLGIGRDREHGLGGGLEQEVVDHGLVLIGDIGDPARQREDDMEVGHRQQLGFARLHPFARLRALTLRAMPVAAAVVRDGGVAAGLVLTCPPSAAVRQLSIARITLSWSRLTWPRLASRQAGPWSRKISATSSDGLPTTAARYAGGPSFVRVRLSSGLVTVRSRLVATWA